MVKLIFQILYPSADNTSWVIDTLNHSLSNAVIETSSVVLDTIAPVSKLKIADWPPLNLDAATNEVLPFLAKKLKVYVVFTATVGIPSSTLGWLVSVAVTL